MTQQTDAQRLDEIRARVGAVEGDWEWIEELDVIWSFPQNIAGDVRDVAPVTVFSFDARIGYDLEPVELAANAPQDMRFLLTQLDGANQKIEELRSRIVWYADKRNYARQNVTGRTPVDEDGGQRARGALGKR